MHVLSDWVHVRDKVSICEGVQRDATEVHSQTKQEGATVHNTTDTTIRKKSVKIEDK